MNNKGQVLVLFVLLLPIALLMFIGTIEIGLLMTKTYKVKSSTKQAINYALETEDISKARIMLKENIGDEFSLSYTNGTVEVEVKGRHKTLFSKMIDTKSYDYSYKYIGYKQNGKIIIKEG